MQKIVKDVDKKRGIVQVTIADERWYLKPIKGLDGLPEILHVPSVTWIASYYYTSPYLVKWIAQKGLDEAEAIKKAAGDKGSKVHKAIDMWLNGEEIRIDTKIENPSTGEKEELTPEENEIFNSFLGFYRDVKPKIISNEYIVWGKGYAGTVDIKCEINGELGILDVKTSQQIYRTSELQISAYKHADVDLEKIEKMWILQVGYRRNKNKYKLTEIEDKFKLFLNAQETWAEENKNTKPKYIEYPTIYPTKEKLDKPKEVAAKKADTPKGSTKK